MLLVRLRAQDAANGPRTHLFWKLCAAAQRAAELASRKSQMCVVYVIIPDDMREIDALTLIALALHVMSEATTAVDRHGSNALLWAAGGGHLACVRFLVESAGMDPEKAVQSGRRSYAGRSALHWAARNGHGDVVEYLLSLIHI